ncbi:ABC transporter permease [Candidatus Aerophobetes bacterium]|nr:ABC transporter permease [Candidatus Aerophobetes bacterium]
MEIEKEKRRLLDFFSEIRVMISRYPAFGALIAFMAIFVTFSIIAPKFLTLRSLTGIFTLVSELGIIAIGEAFLMISGEFDLSVGGVYALGGALFVVLANSLPSFLAFIITLGVAAFIGYVNGVITLRGGIPSFITTLGTMMITRGILLIATGGFSLAYKGDTFVPMILSKLVGYGFRPSHIWFIALALLFSFILTRARYGNWVFAAGGNKEIARMMGVNTDSVKLRNFMISAVMAALAGCMAISRFKFANVAFGQGYELEAIAAVVIGGTSLFGGYGTILGAALGAVMVGMIRIGLVLAGAPGYLYQAFVGVVLITAAIINIKIRRSST